MIYAILPTDSDIQHHGVLGMHWGIRRYQPYSTVPRGSGKKGKEIGLAAKQKRTYKAMKKIAGKTSDPNYEENIKSIVQDTLTKEDHDKIKQSIDKWNDLIDKGGYREFEDSDSATKAWEKAYDDTIKFYKKENPEYLNAIIKDNGGSTENLTAYHDFRKDFDGFSDVALSEARKKWKASSEGKLYKETQKAWDDYIKACENATNKILGKYANKRVSKKGYSLTYGDTLNVSHYWDKLAISKAKLY